MKVTTNYVLFLCNNYSFNILLSVNNKIAIEFEITVIILLLIRVFENDSVGNAQA